MNLDADTNTNADRQYPGSLEPYPRPIKNKHLPKRKIAGYIKIHGALCRNIVSFPQTYMLILPNPDNWLPHRVLASLPPPVSSHWPADLYCHVLSSWSITPRICSHLFRIVWSGEVLVAVISPSDSCRSSNSAKTSSARNLICPMIDLKTSWTLDSWLAPSSTPSINCLQRRSRTLVGFGTGRMKDMRNATCVRKQKVDESKTYPLETLQNGIVRKHVDLKWWTVHCNMDI